MKKILVILAALLVMTCFVACNNEQNNGEPSIDIPSGNPVETPTEDNTPAVDRNFEDKNDTVYVMTPNGAANLRTDTSFEKDTIAISVENGTELERSQADANWSKVIYEGEEYYIANKVIVEATVLDGFEEVSKTVKINAESTLNVRYAPARTNDAPIFTLVAGTEVEVIGFNPDLGSEGWYKIKLTVTEDQPYEYGYISAHSSYFEAPVEE